MNSQKIAHLPTPPEVEAAKISSRTLSKYADADRVQMTLKGSNGQSDDLVLPGPVLQMLLDIMSEMAQGNAISLLPIHHELSTQEAANLLNISRPHLVKLLEMEELPYRKVGSHRRVLAKDVFEYRAKVEKQRLAALDELTGLSQALGMGYEK